MRIEPSGRIFLVKGEIIPVICKGCQHVYQPLPASEISDCPQCSKPNVHGCCEPLEFLYEPDPPGAFQ